MLGHRLEIPFRGSSNFLRRNLLAVGILSGFIVVPCFWHSHIQAGDLGSHVYNAWLAQLIEQRQLPGVTLVHRSNNVLFDLLVLRAANLVGFAAAEKIVVSFAVLVFFWGSFSFLTQASGNPPWKLLPFLFVLSYGYVFHMGFMNYYLSVGFAFFALAAAWPGGAGNWLCALLLSAISLVAHPVGFVLFVAVSFYLTWWRRLSPHRRPVLPILAVISAVLLKFYFALHPGFDARWREQPYTRLLGPDQIHLFGHRFFILSRVVLVWVLLSAIAGIYDWVFRARTPAPGTRLALELYFVALVATFYLPENFHVGFYAGWIGLLVSRLTLVTALFGLLILASLPLPPWTVYGNVLCAVVFFAFVYQDTGKLDRMEANARNLVKELSIGTRVVAVVNPPSDWRIEFIYHSVDRACIGRCFSFANYEASSLQFRVRAAPGNYFVTSSVDQSDDMSSGDYVVRQRDLPLTAIYQCRDGDFTQLCAAPLRAGQKTEDPESEPGSLAAPDDDSEP